jgi:polar amino acid transport system substrate-binding protein
MNRLKSKIIAALFATIAMLFTSFAAVAQESTWDAIKERGTLRVGVTQAPPWFYKDPAGTMDRRWRVNRQVHG